MSLLYSIALLGVTVMILCALIEAIKALHKKPTWTAQRLGLSVVETVDRRQDGLPFVGADRRVAAAGDAAANVEVQRQRA